MCLRLQAEQACQVTPISATPVAPDTHQHLSQYHHAAGFPPLMPCPCQTEQSPVMLALTQYCCVMPPPQVFPSAGRRSKWALPATQGSPSLIASARGSPEPSTPLTQATSYPTPPSPPLLCSPGSLHVHDRALQHQVSPAAFQPCFGSCRSPASAEWHWEKVQLVLNLLLCLFCFLRNKKRIRQELTLEIERERSELPWALSPLTPERRRNPQTLTAMSSYSTEESQSFSW